MDRVGGYILIGQTSKSTFWCTVLQSRMETCRVCWRAKSLDCIYLNNSFVRLFPFLRIYGFRVCISCVESENVLVLVNLILDIAFSVGLKF